MMFQFRLRLPAYLFSLFLLFTWTFFHISGVRAGGPAASSRQVSDVAESVCLFTLRNGVCEPQFYTRRQLAEGRPLKSQGYVVGVVVFGPSDLKVELDDQLFHPVQPSEDGTFQVKGYGTINPADLAARNQSGETPPTATIAPPGRPGVAYCYFPKVFGDAVSPQSKFDLQLVQQNARQTLAINQQPVQEVALPRGRVDKENSPTFHYIGHRLDLLSRQADFSSRLAAIEDGIRMVEDAFHTQLVQNVQLIDLNQKNNALTYEGRKTIWFYIDTVLETSVEELRHIAGHETLHQLVYRLHLTRSPEVRRLFADLWGLDAFSVARFQLVTTGWFDTHGIRPAAQGDLFFAFINEKNFLQGMHGGHSHDNMDEFLTSFIHSLMFIQNLPTTLQSPLQQNSKDGPRALSSNERGELLGWYRKSIDVLEEGTQSNANDARPSDKLNLLQFLQSRLSAVDTAALVQANSKS